MKNDAVSALPEGSQVVRWLRDESSERAMLNASKGYGREQWGEGPWQDEPDIAEWRAPGGKLPRLALRGPHGSWCGYVGVPEGHPMHGKGWEDSEALDVHGGITYGSECSGDICHQPREGEPEHVWWLGFDCSHAWDYSPGLHALLRSLPGGDRLREHETYRDLGYVIGEVEKLARQLEEMAP